MNEVKQYQPKIAEHKKKVINDMTELIKKYPVICIVDMENLPAPQLQMIRAKLRGTVKIVMTKKRFMKIALENMKSEKKGIDALENHLSGMPAFVFTEQNPFKVSSILQRNRSSAPAKPNQIAPADIVVPAGPTQFAPGPIISDLGMIGLKTGVEAGKIVIKNDKVVARKGEKIKPKIADVLSRLKIQPMEVGLELLAAYDKGIIYEKEILSITQEDYFVSIVRASTEAGTLAMEIGYITKETINQLIIKAFVSAKALSEAQEIPLEKPEEKEEVKEEKPEVEEKKPEVKEEKEDIKKEEPKPELKEEVKVEKEEIKEEPKEEIKEKEEEKIQIKELKEKPEPSKIEEPEPEKEITEEPKEEREEPEPKKPEPKKPEPKKEPKKEKPLKKPRMVADAVTQEKAGELLDQLKQTGTFRKEVARKDIKKDVKDVDMSKKKIEELAKKLRKKGTLRDKGGK